ncbi:hypothetical protein [Frankia sp. CcWB2]
MSTEALWYAARGTGTTCLLLLTLTVVLGIVARSGRGLAGLPGFALAVAGSAAWRCSASFRLLPRPHRPPTPHRPLSPRHQPAAPTTMTPRSEQT